MDDVESGLTVQLRDLLEGAHRESCHDGEHPCPGGGEFIEVHGVQVAQRMTLPKVVADLEVVKAVLATLAKINQYLHHNEPCIFLFREAIVLLRCFLILKDQLNRLSSQ